jgi:hypothetical protein
MKLCGALLVAPAHVPGGQRGWGFHLAEGFWSQASTRMLGEPTTPLFSITDLISFELYQVRAFDTSATSWRRITSLGSSVLRNTLLFMMPAVVRSFSFPLLARLLRAISGHPTP